MKQIKRLKYILILLVINAILCFEVQSAFANLPNNTNNAEVDSTSYVYLCSGEYSKNDSIRNFVLFNSHDINQFRYTFYGLHASEIKGEPRPPIKFHINIKGNPIKENYPNWILVPIVFSIVLVLIASMMVKKLIEHLALIVVFQNSFETAVSERNVNADKGQLILIGNYILNVALFVIICLFRQKIILSISWTTALFVIILAIFAIFIVKLLASTFLASVFNCRQIQELYYKNNFYIMELIGVILLPLNCLSFYTNYENFHNVIFYISCIVCILAIIFKWLRLTKIIISKHFSIFYLFLYLCAVEILPVLVCIRLLTNY